MAATGKRQNFSRKRTLILQALRGTKCHPTADWIYSQLKPDYPDLSLATVYRNLRGFCESGKAVSVGVFDGQEHFDGQIMPHAHLHCENCGALIDLPQEYLGRKELDSLSQRTGCQVDSVSVLFRGLCPACQGKEKKSPSEL